MKAAFIERHGGPEVLKYGDLPDPTAAPGEVVIDIIAASVNGADWKVRVGDYKQSKFPYVLARFFRRDQRRRRGRRGPAPRRRGVRRLRGRPRGRLCREDRGQ